MHSTAGTKPSARTKARRRNRTKIQMEGAAGAATTTTAPTREGTAAAASSTIAHAEGRGGGGNTVPSATAAEEDKEEGEEGGEEGGNDPLEVSHEYLRQLTQTLEAWGVERKKVADIERKLGEAKHTIGSMNRKIMRLTEEKKRKLDLIESNVEEFYKKMKETVNEFYKKMKETVNEENAVKTDEEGKCPLERTELLLNDFDEK
jgi:hypothetical protein